VEPDLATFAQRWKQFRDAGDPLVPPPSLWGARAGIAEQRPSVHALLYELDAFETLDEFDAFCTVIEPAARLLAEHGPASGAVQGSWTAGDPAAAQPRTPVSPDIASALIAPVDMTDGPTWAWGLQWQDARFNGSPGATFSVVGRTVDGWATVFVVEEPVRSPFG
jgi:hypothetical protein